MRTMRLLLTMMLIHNSNGRYTVALTEAAGVGGETDADADDGEGGDGSNNGLVIQLNATCHTLTTLPSCFEWDILY